MVQWLCPHCQRRFGRANQAHECERALTLDEYLTRQPVAHRALYRAVLKALSKVGPVDVDPVEVGVMIKRSRTFCELRPKRDAVELSFKLSRPLASPRIRRSVRTSVHRRAYFVHLESTADVDAEILRWLTQAYQESRD